MKLRNESASNRMFGTVLVAALVLLGHSTSWAQTLTPSANPSSGAAGVNNSYITGSGFPAGTITGATVSLGLTCAGPAAASTPASQVTVIGTLRRFQFLIPGSLAPGNYKVWVSGKAGATPFNTVNTPSCSSITLASRVQGTASLGAAIVNGAVTLVDSAGTVRTGTTASDGSYIVDTTGLVPPFLVKVVTTADSGAFPAGTALYSVSADGGASSRINVTVLSDLIMRSYYSAQNINPNAAFLDPVGDPAPSPAAVASLAGILLPTLRVWLDQAGLDVTSLPPSGDAINLISSPLIAYPPGVTPTAGLDVMLHKVSGEALNPDGSVAAITIAAGTVTETIDPSFTSGTAAFTFSTIDSATNTGSAGSFSTLVLTPALEPVLDGIQAGLDVFKNIVNAKGAALTGADLLPVYTADYLQNGQNATQDANQNASDLAGVTILELSAVGIRSLNNNVADVLIHIRITDGIEFEEDTDTVTMKNDGGTWKQYGNQRVAAVNANVEARTFQGGSASPPGGINTQVDVFAGADAPHLTVTGVTITGPTNNPVAIWNGQTSRALQQGAGFINNGLLRDQWFQLSSPLGNTLSAVSALVPPGSNFNFNLTTNGLGSPQYSVKSNVFTTENVQFTSLPAHIALAAAVNHTLNFTFTLPKTFAINGVALFAQIFNGLPNNVSVVSCNIGSNGPLTLDFVNHTGSGSITFPANMSACGLNPSVLIQFINVFFEVDGAAGENSITFAGIPY